MNKQMKQRTSLLICMAVMGVTVNAYAADVTATSSDTEPHTINVTANRMALMDLDTPAAMDVITEQDIMNSGAKNAFDAVSMTTGVTSFS